MTLVILTVAGGAPPTPAVVSGALELQSVRASAPAARFSPARHSEPDSMRPSAHRPSGPSPASRSTRRSVPTRPDLQSLALKRLASGSGVSSSAQSPLLT
jgi:hypothetical protein